MIQPKTQCFEPEESYFKNLEMPGNQMVIVVVLIQHASPSIYL